MYGGGGRTVSITSLFLSYLKWNKMKVNGELERENVAVEIDRSSHLELAWNIQLMYRVALNAVL